jgi:hypothetical protein
LAQASRASEADRDEPVRIEKWAFEIPLLIGKADAERLKEAHLLVSTDRGKTWKKVATVRPKGEVVRLVPFTAPCDGLYWFSCVVVWKEGKKDPPDPSQLRPTLVVEVALHPAYGKWELRPRAEKGGKVSRRLWLTLNQSGRGELIVEHATADGAVVTAHEFTFDLPGSGDRRTLTVKGGPFKKETVLPFALNGGRLWIKGGAVRSFNAEVSVRGKWSRAAPRK